ncbi:hypothetical protein PG989_015560 [Apiospora arundinis]
MYYFTGNSAGYMIHNLTLSDHLYQTDIDGELESIISCPSKYQAALDDFDSFRESLKAGRSADPTFVDFERWAFISSLFLAGFKEPPKHFDMIFSESAKADIDGGLGREPKSEGTESLALSFFGDTANFPKRWRGFPSNKPESPEDMFRHLEARLMEKRVYFPDGEYSDEGAMVYLARARTELLWGNYDGALHDACLLAEVHLALGEYVTAQNELAEIVKFAHKVNGPSHPETLRYESLLAFANWHVGKLDAAYKGARKTLVTIRKECFAYRIGPSSGSQREIVLITASAPVEKETETSQLKLLKETAQLLINSQSDETINPSVFLTLGVMARAGSARYDTAKWREGRNFALGAIWVEAMDTTSSRPPLLALTYKIDSLCRDELPNMHGQNTAHRMKRVYDDKRIVLGRNDPSTMAARRDLITYQQCTSKKWEDPDLNMGTGGAIDMDEGDGYPVMVVFKEIVDIHEEHFGWEHPETIRLAESLFLKSQLAVIIELMKLDENDRAFWGTTAIHINREICDTIDRLPDHRPGLPSKGDLAPLRRSVGIRLVKQRELAEIFHIDDREATLPLHPESAGTGRSDRKDERAMCELLASVLPSKLQELVENDHKSALIDIQEAERREMDYMVE